MQKVMYKGLVPEDKTLREMKVTSGAKIMVVGSTINDVLAVNTPKDAAQQDAKAEESKKEPLCRQKVSPLGHLCPGRSRLGCVCCSPSKKLLFRQDPRWEFTAALGAADS